MKKRFCTAALCVALCAALLPTAFFPARAAAASAPKIFVLEQAQNLGVAADNAIRKKNSEIVLKGIKYTEAVAGARAKAKNLSTFRWTPLLKFKFPEPFDLTLDYDLTVKPLTLQIEITTLNHEKADLVYEAKRKIAKLFTRVYVGQETVSFVEAKLAAAETDLRRNEARLILGKAKKADVDRLAKSVEALRASLSLAMRSFETDKKDLTDLIKLDVTTGYVFMNPLKTANITREQLASLLAFTLQNDHIYYAARMDESVARINLDSYENLFRRQYGGKVNAISPYLNQARNGNDIDTGSFRAAYDSMTVNLDSPWAGKKRILFFSFSREWFKGAVDGTRYIEDEIYALYTAALDYLSARKDRETAERDLRKEVASSYEALVTAKNAADALIASVAEAKTALNRLVELNKLGKADFTEVADKQADYQDLQTEAVEALAAYNELLFDFDRLTCGAVSKLLVGAGLETDAGMSGISRADKATYHIYADVADKVFAFGVQIPEDYEPEIDAFEIWYDGVRIGERTPVEKELRHLTLDYGADNRLTVRLYNGDEYVDECEIDTTTPSDVLELHGAVAESAQDRVVGSYAVDISRATGTVAITLAMNERESAAFYRLSADGGALLKDDLIPISQPFKYLSLLSLGITDVRAELFDSARRPLYTARFEPSTMSLCVPEQ
ncbi:MAG: TolC family protein [Clostridiales Family XIII bacterium]|nr:TolC family protein [Clostridiales Family XIII bacterium]